MNTLTAFIDVGQVYGSDDAKARLLRDLSNDKGLLRVNEAFTDNGRELLPPASMMSNMCATRGRITGDNNAQEVPCFLAGEPAGISKLKHQIVVYLIVGEQFMLELFVARMQDQWVQFTCQV